MWRGVCACGEVFVHVAGCLCMWRGVLYLVWSTLARPLIHRKHSSRHHVRSCCELHCISSPPSVLSVFFDPSMYEVVEGGEVELTVRTDKEFDFPFNVTIMTMPDTASK